MPIELQLCFCEIEYFLAHHNWLSCFQCVADSYGMKKSLLCSAQLRQILVKTSISLHFKHSIFYNVYVAKPADHCPKYNYCLYSFSSTKSLKVIPPLSRMSALIKSNTHRCILCRYYNRFCITQSHKRKCIIPKTPKC